MEASWGPARCLELRDKKRRRVLPNVIRVGVAGKPQLTAQCIEGIRFEVRDLDDDAGRDAAQFEEQADRIVQMLEHVHEQRDVKALPRESQCQAPGDVRDPEQCVRRGRAAPRLLYRGRVVVDPDHPGRVRCCGSHPPTVAASKVEYTAARADPLPEEIFGESGGTAVERIAPQLSGDLEREPMEQPRAAQKEAEKPVASEDMTAQRGKSIDEGDCQRFGLPTRES